MASVTSSSAGGGSRSYVGRLDKIVALVLAVAFIIIGGWNLAKTLSAASAKQAFMNALNHYEDGFGPAGHRILADYLSTNTDIDVNQYFKARTLLGIATECGYSDIVDELLKRGANPNLYSTGDAPLFIACINDRYHIAELLIAHGANVNETDIYGWGPLSRAAEVSMHPDLIRLMIAHGANVNFINPNGTSPLDFALQRTDPEGKIIAGILEAAGGRAHQHQVRR